MCAFGVGFSIGSEFTLLYTKVCMLVIAKPEKSQLTQISFYIISYNRDVLTCRSSFSSRFRESMSGRMMGLSFSGKHRSKTNAPAMLDCTLEFKIEKKHCSSSKVYSKRKKFQFPKNAYASVVDDHICIL